MLPKVNDFYELTCSPEIERCTQKLNIYHLKRNFFNLNCLYLSKRMRSAQRSIQFDSLFEIRSEFVKFTVLLYRSFSFLSKKKYFHHLNLNALHCFAWQTMRVYIHKTCNKFCSVIMQFGWRIGFAIRTANSKDKQTPNKRKKKLNRRLFCIIEDVGF